MSWTTKHEEEEEKAYQNWVEHERRSRMSKAVLMKDVEYNGVTHRKGTGWKLEKGTAYIRGNIVYVIAGYGETMNLVIGKDVCVKEAQDETVD